jgi:Holliday junction resolvase-like predicted endonuclease
MAHNVGEEIAGLYLQIDRGCDFVQYNLYTPDVQGEIDVVAVNFADRIVYVCEVAVHLVTGLQYVKGTSPDTLERFLKKFNKDIDYAEKAFPDFDRRYMLWSPIVKSSGPTAKYDQMKAVEEVQRKIRLSRGVEIDLVVNEAFQDVLSKLKAYAGTKTEELKSPVLRLLQIEALLERHIQRRARRPKTPD